MNNLYKRNSIRSACLVALLLLLGNTATTTQAQSFDFAQLEQRVNKVSVIIDLKFEISFGMHSAEHEEQLLGTIVTEDGLVMFNGGLLSNDQQVPSMPGYTIKTTPVQIDIKTMDGRTFAAEYVGFDRFTRIGFLQIKHENEKFSPVTFKSNAEFTVGNWVALYMLLPEFVTPPLAADIGMISTVVESPETFPLTIGLNALQINCVLYNEQLEAIGVLGTLDDPASASQDASGMLEAFSQMRFPMLGVITAKQLNKLIANPPRKGEIDRGWLGITLQALTTDMIGFWNLDVNGGIIVNSVVEGSPAGQGGLTTGDIIYEINGLPIDVNKEEMVPLFQRNISEMGPNTPVEFSVLRRDEQVIDTVRLLTVLGDAPTSPSDAPEFKSDPLELKVRDLVFADHMRNQTTAETLKGVVVSQLEQGGLSDMGGLQIGDIIQQIDSEPITNVEEAETILKKIEEQKPQEVIFFVWRNSKTMFVNVKTDW